MDKTCAGFLGAILGVLIGYLNLGEIIAFGIFGFMAVMIVAFIIEEMVLPPRRSRDRRP